MGGRLTPCLDVKVDPNLSGVPAVTDTKQLVVLGTLGRAQTIAHVRALGHQPLLLRHLDFAYY
jgi:hypothetical protein